MATTTPTRQHLKGTPGGEPDPEPNLKAARQARAKERAPQIETQKIAWQPNPGPQTSLITCPLDEILYGGAKGGGKSDGILGDFLAHVSANALHARHARGVIFRKAYPDLEQLIDRSKEIYPAVGAIWKEQKKTWVFPGGATLKFRFLDNAKDAKKYQGHEYSWIAFDEVGDVGDRAVVDTLRGALRNSKGVKVRLVLSGNPMGDGHAWLYERFIAGPKPKSILPPYTPQVETLALPGQAPITWTRVFIPAKLEDNPIFRLKDPGYEMRLWQMTYGKPWLYKALRDGDWTIVPEVPGALLTTAILNKFRVGSLHLGQIQRTVIALDPSGSGNPEADEVGIVVSGAIDRHKYVLQDASMQASPGVWASTAVKLYHKWRCNGFVAEINFGGEMVAEMIRGVDPNIVVEMVTVSKGKHIRAEPVSAEYDRGFIHHVGTHAKLEQEWTTWLPDGKHKSPNRLDAAVMGLHWLSDGSDGLNIRDL